MPGSDSCVAMVNEIRQVYELLQNDNDTETIVYTSKEFQPMSETSSDKFAFTGPSRCGSEAVRT